VLGVGAGFSVLFVVVFFLWGGGGFFVCGWGVFCWGWGGFGDFATLTRVA